MYLSETKFNMTLPTKLLRAAAICLMAALPAFSQQDAQKTPQDKPASKPLTKFDLDFPGGSPEQLVAAIQKAMGRPLNVIVPTQLTDLTMPPLKMARVDVSQLFMAMTEASQHQEFIPRSQLAGQTYNASYSYRTNGNPTDESVWYLQAVIAPSFEQPKRTQFFLLTPYLDTGLTVDDITTAIQTGWKMAGDTAGGELSYHKETKLLIVVASDRQFETVNSALQALHQQKPKLISAADNPPESPKPEK